MPSEGACERQRAVDLRERSRREGVAYGKGRAEEEASRLARPDRPVRQPEDPLDDVDLSRDPDSDPLWDWTGYVWDGETMVPSGSEEKVKDGGSPNKQTMTQAQFRAKNRPPGEQPHVLTAQELDAELRRLDRGSE